MVSTIVFNPLFLEPSLSAWCDEHGIYAPNYIQDIALSNLQNYCMGNCHYSAFYEDLSMRIEDCFETLPDGIPVDDRSPDIYAAITDYILSTQGLVTFLPYVWETISTLPDGRIMVKVDLDEIIDVDYLPLSHGQNILDIQMLGVN